MLRLLTMGVVLPAIILTSVAVSIGAVALPRIDTPDPASLVLLATGVACFAAVKRLRR